MKRYLFFGLLLFIGFAVVSLPATLVNQLTQRSPGLDILQPAGTIWRGSGQLLVEGHALGTLTWRFLPAKLLGLSVGYDLHLAVPEPGNAPGQATAVVDLSLGRDLHADVTADVDTSMLQPWLERYEIVMSGRLNTQDLRARLNLGDPWGSLEADGRIDWSGGLASYYLAATLVRQRLQAMYAQLATPNATPRELRADVYGEESYPLMQFTLNDTGFAKIGISKRLSQIVGSPWPGGDPDHAIILEVEQPLF